jgi:hypothetical protein
MCETLRAADQIGAIRTVKLTGESVNERSCVIRASAHDARFIRPPVPLACLRAGVGMRAL